MAQHRSVPCPAQSGSPSKLVQFLPVSPQELSMPTCLA